VKWGFIADPNLTRTAASIFHTAFAEYSKITCPIKLAVIVVAFFTALFMFIKFLFYIRKNWGVIVD